MDARVAGDLAARSAQLGYASLWSNDDPTAPGLETLAHFAAGAPSLDLGVGVLPLHRYSPTEIAADVDRLGLDPARLWVGIGSGQLHPQLDAVRRAVGELRNLLPSGTRIAVAAMRPALCHLGGAIADGVLLNWMPPAPAAQARQWVHQGAEDADVAPPVTALYVRVAVKAHYEAASRFGAGRNGFLSDTTFGEVRSRLRTVRRGRRAYGSTSRGPHHPTTPTHPAHPPVDDASLAPSDLG